MILTVTMNPSLDKIYFVEDYKLGKVHRPTETIASPGGKGLNVARVAKLMGQEVAATGPLGGGVGDYIRQGVKALGIHPEFCPIQGESRTCINVSDIRHQRSTEVLEAGPKLSDQEVQAQSLIIESLLDHINVMTISGSLARGLPADYYKQLISLAKAKGVRTLLDSSGAAFVQGLKAKPYAIKPNEDEIHQVYDGPLTSMDDQVLAIKYFKSYGIELPIISMGSEGALAGLEDGIYKVSIPPITVVNTVGSGDAFMAGLAVGLEGGLPQADLLRMATACGTANTQYPQTGFVEPKIVAEYYDKVSVTQIATY